MKEIGTLIELLNEYDENRKIGKNGLYKHEEYEPMEEYIISKNFGFIKWLVENDKIDRDKLKFQSDFMFPLWKDFDQLGSEEIIEYSNYESLLMLLAISDAPIEDLVSYLK